MRDRFLTTVAVAAIVAFAALGSTPVSGQTRKASGARRPAPRAADGHPDLQGVWDFRTMTPRQRPAEYAGKETLTEAEALEFERKNALNQDNRESKPTAVQNGQASSTDVDRAYNDFW